MKPFLLPFAFAMLFAAHLQAGEVEILATYHTDSGSLPPEHAWATDVTILADGALTLVHCKGYETEPPGCETVTGTVTPEALDTIRATAVASGLADRPAAETDDPQIGGGGVSGSVVLEGVTLPLPRDPATADAGRVAEVLTAIAAAIPADLVPQPD